MSEWQRYASDAAFRARYAGTVQRAQALRRDGHIATHLHYAVIELVKDGSISRDIVEYEFAEAEIRHDLKQYASRGYLVRVVATDLTIAEATLLATGLV